jgi:hypothetical protein
MIFGEISAFPSGGNHDTSGKTARNPRLNGGETTGIFIIAGQSNCCNSVDTLYAPTNASKVDNLNIYDGGMYAATDPLLGCHNIPGTAGMGNTFGRMADKLIDAGTYQRVILVPIGIGATTVAMWEPSQILFQRFLVAHRRLGAFGLTPQAVLWMQGESDHATTQADYEESLSAIITTLQSAGHSTPWLVGQCTYNAGSTSSAVRAAQAAIVDGINVFSGADTDTLTGTSVYRQADNTHLTAAGADAAADLWQDAILASL